MSQLLLGSFFPILFHPVLLFELARFKILTSESLYART